MTPRRDPRGVGLLPVVMITLFLLPLIMIFLKRAGDEVGFSFRDRHLRMARNVAVSPLTDYMQLFSEDPRGDHYRDAFLSRTWGTGETVYGVYYSSVTWNAREYTPFNEARWRQERLFAFSTRAKVRTRNEPVRGQSGVIQFQSDLTRYALISEATLSIGATHPLSGRTVDSMWIGSDLDLTAGAFGLGAAFQTFPFANKGLAVVLGNVIGTPDLGGGRAYIGGVGGFTGGTNINFVPVEISTVAPGIGDLSYFENHGTTATVVNATITFLTGPNRLEIDRGGGAVAFNVSGETVLVAREGASLFINDNGLAGLNFPLTVVTLGGGSIYINGGVRYSGGGAANATRSFAALSTGDLIIRGPGTATTGFYYCEGTIEVAHPTVNQLMTLNGVLMTRSGLFANVPNGVRLNIVFDTELRAYYPPMLPERPRLVKLQVRT